MLHSLLCITPSFALFSIILVLAPTTLSLANPQRPLPPPEACYRRNDTLPACPYGGKCYPNRSNICVTACQNYQASDNRFWLCNLDCSYQATTLSGKLAENPLVCVQPTARNGLTCMSGWACFRRFSAKPPLYKTQGPVCSPDYTECSQIGVEGGLQASNLTAEPSITKPECSSGSLCITDPRARFVRPAVAETPGICVPTAKACSGKRWNECGETEHCVADPRCDGKLGTECGGLCVRILGPTWGSYNATIYRRHAKNRRC